jgi:hypothetical protein
MSDDHAGLAEPDDLETRRAQARDLQRGLSAARARPAADPVARLVARAWAQFERKAFQTAIGLADQALAQDIGRAGAWLCKAHSLAALGNLDRAIAELHAGRRIVTGAADARPVDEALEAYVRRRTARPVEEARRALRHGRPDEAVDRLTACAPAFAGDEDFRRRLTYAEDWRDAAAQRRPHTASSRLTHAALQTVLAWLCDDELRLAEQAAEAGRLRAAADFYHNALRFDRRFTRAALLRAVTLRRLGLTAQRPDTDRGLARSWRETADDLATAARLARYAREDRALTDEATAALTDIDRDRARAVKVAAMFACFAEWNSLGRHYAQERRITWLEYSNFRSSFAPFAAKVDALVARYRTDDPEIGRGLTQLAEIVAQVRANMR